MVAGALIGAFAPSVTDALSKADVERVNIPIAILVWLMIYPMLLNIDVSTLRDVGSNYKALLVTAGVNYLVQPFTMFALAVLFFRVVFANIMSEEEQRQYVAGSVILGGAPCTAMVFVWSYLVGGHAAYTAMQVALNDLLMLVAYVPTVGLLIGATDLSIPWGTIAASVGLFIVVPGIAAAITRYWFLQSEKALASVQAFMKPISMTALVLTIVLIFVFQGAVIEERIVDILLVSVPLSIQTVAVFAIAYGLMYVFQVPFVYAAPGALIAASNFFEMAVAVAISAYGAGSSATLATVVGVLTEVPLMLSLVWACNYTRDWFDFPDAGGVSAKVAEAGGPGPGDELPGEPPHSVVFVCGANRCRSIMAEALLKHAVRENKGDARLHPSTLVASAGSRPSQPHPLALKALGEIGVSAEGLRSKGTGDPEVKGILFDAAFLLCDDASCPIPPKAAKKVHRLFPDPDRHDPDEAEQEQMKRFRAVRDSIKLWIERDVVPLLRARADSSSHLSAAPAAAAGATAMKGKAEAAVA